MGENFVVIRAALAVAVASASLLFSHAAAAQDGGSSPRENAAAMFDEMARCRSIAADADRLACFDRTSSALVEARDRKDVVLVDRAEVRRTRRSLFGFPLPKIGLFGGDDDDPDREPEIKEITSKLVSVSPSGFQRWMVELEDGSRWQTTEAAKAPPPKPGREIRVTRAAMGGYFLHLGSQAIVRARRVE